MRKKVFKQKLLAKIRKKIKPSQNGRLEEDTEIIKPRRKPDNPCISTMRTIVEELLKRRGQSYRSFYPVILDLDDPQENLPDTFSLEMDNSEAEAIAKYELETELVRLGDQMNEVLALLAPGLNRLLIRTNRPAYFADFVQTMYEEAGLPVQLEENGKQPFPPGSTVLDFGTSDTIDGNGLREDILYLPIYKKTWEITANLDIVVPIGYNTVIVKGAIPREEESAPDWFEREFYTK